ncbi:hypothetical protein ACOSQ3_000735 [Xanthoceras sorbifolium]
MKTRKLLKLLNENSVQDVVRIRNLFTNTDVKLSSSEIAAQMPTRNKDAPMMSQLKDAVLEGGIPFNRVHGMHAFEYSGLV